MRVQSLALAERQLQTLQGQRSRVGELVQEALGALDERVGGEGPVHQAPAFGFRDGDPPAGVEPLHRDRGRHQAGERDARVVGATAALGLGNREEDPLGDDSQVARQRELEPAGDRRTVDDRDRRLPGVDHDLEQAAPAVVKGTVEGLPGVRQLASVLEVRARAEGRAGARDRDGVHLGVVVRVDQGVDQRVVERPVECVASVGSVEREPAGAATVLDQQDVVGHRATSLTSHRSGRRHGRSPTASR